MWQGKGCGGVEVVRLEGLCKTTKTCRWSDLTGTTDYRSVLDWCVGELKIVGLLIKIVYDNDCLLKGKNLPLWTSRSLLHFYYWICFNPTDPSPCSKDVYLIQGLSINNWNKTSNLRQSRVEILPTLSRVTPYFLFVKYEIESDYF